MSNESKIQAINALTPYDSVKALMAELRGKNGCAWDKKQTLNSLQKYVVEECYELVEAMTRVEKEVKNQEAIEHHKEELGDVFLQVLFQARIQEEQRNFSLDDVLLALKDKLVRRHPHIFGDETPDPEASGNPHWQRVKEAEKKNKKQSAVQVSNHLPTLLYASEIGKQVCNHGFDWPSHVEALDSLKSEVSELEEALGHGNSAEIEHELGDILLAASQVARFLQINPDLALRNSANRFKSRFERVLEITEAKKLGPFKSMSTTELNALWAEAKQSLVTI